MLEKAPQCVQYLYIRYFDNISQAIFQYLPVEMTKAQRSRSISNSVRLLFIGE